MLFTSPWIAVMCWRMAMNWELKSVTLSSRLVMRCCTDLSTSQISSFEISAIAIVRGLRGGDLRLLRVGGALRIVRFDRCLAFLGLLGRGVCGFRLDRTSGVWLRRFRLR